MERMEFLGHFALLDYALTHKVLLLRKSELKGEVFYNTDILFLGTFYVEIATWLDDLIIEIGGEQDLNYVKIKSQGHGTFGKAFVIASSGNKYYIGAGQIEIQENNLDGFKTSIGSKKQQ